MRRTSLYKAIVFTIVILLMNHSLFSQTGIISGKVRRGDGVLQAATVSLGNKTVLTNYNGEFSCSVKQGNYKLIITHIGYKKIELEITVDAGTTQNFDFDMEPYQQMGEIVVLGSRSLIHRSNLNTPVPVDAFSSFQLQQTGQTSLMQMLNFTAPSVNASLPFVSEPITLRGLYPDQTLILLNGTRYNNIAYINPGLPRGQLGKGSVANDLNTVPFSAIEKIEILRDGASAQYGSDAVAGVINIILKETTGKTSVNLHLGQFYKGDGETITMGIYHGFDLVKKGLPAGRHGFLNFSGDFLFRNPTFRGGEHTGTVYKNYNAGATHDDSLRIKAIDDSIVRAKNFDRMNVSNAGNTKSISYGILMNGAYSFNNKTKLFWTGAVNNRPLFFVLPYTLPKNTSFINTELFPEGFKGTIKLNAWNVSGIAGAKGVTGKQIHWEYRSAYGMNSNPFTSENTNNASQQYILGKNAPTTFYAGTLIYQQLTNNLHFTKNIFNPQNKLKTINVSWGAELRFENFRMKAGEEASWKNYDPLSKKQPGLPGSQVVSPNDVVNKSRNVKCVYIDIETEHNDRFLINLASRFENYSDFGSNLAGKLAALYKLSEKLSVRGSVSNGFRAPTMQQRYWGALTPLLANIGGVITPITSGIFNNDHQVSKLFGVPPLEAERSVNLGGGLTSTLSRHIYLTIDAYWIQVKNRVVMSGAFYRSKNHEVDSLLNDPSLGDYPYIDRVQFFSNAINTRTIGIDFVMHGNWNIHTAQLIAIIAANVTNTRQFGEIKTAANLSATPDNQNTLFNDEARTNLESGQPQDKIMISLNYKKKHMEFMLRNTHFGKTAFLYLGNPKETFSSKILTDLSTSYAPKSWLTITAGANNIFDVYPDRIKNEKNTYEGRNIYAMDGSQFGYNGGYYFVSMNFNFR
jgi:iron complex outermembrane receptor protein